VSNALAVFRFQNLFVGRTESATIPAPASSVAPPRQNMVRIAISVSRLPEIYVSDYAASRAGLVGSARRYLHRRTLGAPLTVSGPERRAQHVDRSLAVVELTPTWLVIASSASSARAHHSSTSSVRSADASEVVARDVEDTRARRAPSGARLASAASAGLALVAPQPAVPRDRAADHAAGRVTCTRASGEERNHGRLVMVHVYCRATGLTTAARGTGERVDALDQNLNVREH